MWSDKVLSDEVIAATELNRRSGAILDKARDRLITIARNSEQFVLAPRGWMQELSARQGLQEELVEVMAALLAATNGEYGAKYGWLRALEGDELREMGAELHAAYHSSLEKGEPGEFRAVLHEWRESADANASPEHRAAYEAEAAPVALTPALGEASS